MRKSLIILGSGYTARFLLPLASRRYTHVFATSRDPDMHLGHIAPDRRIRFDLNQQDTWGNISQGADLLWPFPAVPIDLVQKFSATWDPPPRRLAVLGSTSAYEVGDSREYPPPWIDETASIDLNKPRVQGEEFLRTSCGAIVLRVAGIYGPGRNPLDWIKSGRVSPSRKYVNLIHIEDLAMICLAALEHGTPGEIYNVSDGTPRTWTEIYQAARQRWGLPAIPEKEETTTGKRIANGKLLSMLEIIHAGLHHSKLFKSLEQIQDGTLTP